jgi:hypothetical protein
MANNLTSYNGYASAFDIQVGTSGTYTVVNGINIGAPSASGVTVQFNIPVDMEDTARLFTVAATNGDANGTVIVSGVSTNRVNGGTGIVTVSNLASKQFYNVSGVNWVSF